MWRTLRQVFFKRSGNPANLRLGQVQVSEKNDEVNPLSLNLECKVLRHGKAHLLDHDLARIEDGFNLMRTILVSAKTKRKENDAKISSYVGGEEENCNCGTFLDELK
ncbi:hypothetical protein QZH41_009202, partial [Actinostola sp. cb2023]